jgi:hypothetical protein
MFMITSIETLFSILLEVLALDPQPLTKLEHDQLAKEMKGLAVLLTTERPFRGKGI